MQQAENTLDAQLLDIMLRAGSRWVLWLLLSLSLLAVAVMAFGEPNLPFSRR